MGSPRYLYVSDQGRVFSSEDEPTAEDFERCAVGMLTIVRLESLCYRGRGARWRRVPAGAVCSVEIEGERSPPFHRAAMTTSSRIKT